MHTSTAAVILGALASVAATVPAPVSYTTANWTTNFETTTPQGTVRNDFSLPGAGHDLQWNLQQGYYHFADGGCIGVCPDTFPVEAGFNTTDAAKSASITTTFTNSKTVSFDLHEFAFGCEQLQPVGSPDNINYETDPVPCTLQVSGQSAAKGPVLLSTHTYTPQVTPHFRLGVPSAPMTTIKLPATFHDLTSVWFNATTNNDAKHPYPAAVYLDSFQYSTKSRV